MTAKDRPRFDIDALRDFAGAKVFARGEAYHRDGHVQLLAVEPARVLAQVWGTEDYRIVLTGRGRSIDGECSCPAFEDWGFCKHMVATALEANAAGSGRNAEGAGALARIRDHLKEKGADALVDMIIEQAERDPALFRKLDMAAASVDEDDRTLESRLRKAIDGATRTRDYVEYGEAEGWAEGVDSALDAVAALVGGNRAGLALKLVEHAMSRIEGAIESIDDSDGHCGALLHRVRDIHLAACRAARPNQPALARKLFSRETESDHDTFCRAVALYADVLGEEGLAEYRRLATAAWQKLPPRTGPGEAADDYSRLADMLDFFAERDGDVEARIALRSKDLSSPWRYLRLAEFCCEQGRADEALRLAEEGLWVFEDGPPDARLVVFAAELLSKAGRRADAEARLWKAFEKAPSFDLYQRLRKLGGEAARDRALSHLEPGPAKARRLPWGSPADLLIHVLVEEKMLDPAWAALRRHGASRPVKDLLAEASEATHPRDALEVYAERVEEFVCLGGNRNYEEAGRLIGRMAALRSAPEQAAHVADLKERHGRKRNLMKLLG